MSSFLFFLLPVTQHTRHINHQVDTEAERYSFSSVGHKRARIHTHMHTQSCTQPQRGKLQGGKLLPKEEQKRGKKMGKEEDTGKSTVWGREERIPLSQQAIQSCLAMSPCHRHGNTEPADSFWLIGSCQGNDKINVVFDGNIVRWAW